MTTTTQSLQAARLQLNQVAVDLLLGEAKVSVDGEQHLVNVVQGDLIFSALSNALAIELQRRAGSQSMPEKFELVWNSPDLLQLVFYMACRIADLVRDAGFMGSADIRAEG